MASTFLVSEILTDIARTANVPAFAADTNVTLTQATYWTVQSARSLSARMRQAFGDDADFLRISTITTTPSLWWVSLPADLGELHSVVWARTSSDYRLLRAGNMEELELLADGDLVPWSNRADPTYRLEGETLGFYPASTEAETVYLFYTGHLNLSGETYFANRLDSDRWLTLDVAIRVLQSQSRDATPLIQEKLMLEANLFAPSRRRQPHVINTIRDTREAHYRRIGRNWER